MPNPNYQIVPIRPNSFYHAPRYHSQQTAKSLQNLHTFGKVLHEDKNNIHKAFEERTTPYYYNELTQMHAQSNSNHAHQFISNSNLARDEIEDDFNH